jgi:teichuronic acid biosynthesis glycosyltransferase TuaH
MNQGALRSIWRKLPFRIRKSSFVHYLYYHLSNWRHSRLNIKYRNRIKKQNLSFLQEVSNRITVISWPTYDWNIPLKQRPQHIAESLSQSGKVYYIFTTRNAYDKLYNPIKLANNLLLHCDFWSIAKDVDFIHVYANDPLLNKRMFKKIEKLKKKIIYEILDDFSPDLQGGNSLKIKKRHNYALKSKFVTLTIATSQPLLDKAIAAGADKESTIYIPNGCDTLHFQLKKMKTKNKFIVGYFGALASWVDYEIIEHIAKSKPEWTIRLIGIDYDGSLPKSKILRNSNIHYAGIIPYEKLPSQIDFDVAILPFKLNTITQGTSPIKIYEYLASGFPVVSTPLPECLVIPSVSVAKDASEFLGKIQSEGDNDSNFLRDQRRKYAELQSWKHRSDSIIQFLESSKIVNS